MAHIYIFDDEPLIPFSSCDKYKRNTKQRRRSCTVFVVLEKVFDRVPREVVRWALQTLGVVVCPFQPSSSVNSGCPGPESSVLVSSRWACPISSQVTGHWGELCNRTGEVHPVDPFHSLDILKNHFASVAFCRNSGVYNVQNGAVIELSFVVSVKGFLRHWWMEVDC